MKNVFLRLCGGFSVMIRPDSDMGLDLRTLDCFDGTMIRNAIMLKLRILTEKLFVQMV